MVSVLLALHVLFVFVALVSGSSLIGVYAPSNTFTNLRSLSTVDGSIIPGSDIPIPVQANDYQNAGGEYDAITNTYSYSISENGAAITVVDIQTKTVKSFTLPCSPKCGQVWSLTAYQGKIYGYAAPPSQSTFEIQSIYPFSFDLKSFSATGFWYEIPRPFFNWVWGVRVGVSVINGKTNIYTLLYNATDNKIVWPVFAHFTTIQLESEHVTIQPTSTSISGARFIFDYSDGSLWSFDTSSLVHIDISNPAAITATSVFSGFTGFGNGVLDLVNQKFYTIAETGFYVEGLIVFDLRTKNSTIHTVTDDQSSILNLSLIP